MKEEVIWFSEFSSLEEAREGIGRWIDVDYNRFYVHSELGYRSPEEFEGLHFSRKSAFLWNESSSRGEYLDMDWSEKIVYNANGEVVFCPTGSDPSLAEWIIALNL